MCECECVCVSVCECVCKCVCVCVHACMCAHVHGACAQCVHACCVCVRAVRVCMHAYVCVLLLFDGGGGGEQITKILISSELEVEIKTISLKQPHYIQNRSIIITTAGLYITNCHITPSLAYSLVVNQLTHTFKG